jgi:hypothetical protein
MKGNKMKKQLISVSFAVVAVVQFSGCGGSSSGSKDEIAPSFTNKQVSFDVNESTTKMVNLTSDDANAVFSGVGVLGSTLTFKAPLVDADVQTKITVTAKDKLGNSSTQVFTFNVKDLPVAKLGYVAKIGNKEFTRNGDNLKGPSGLVWQNANSNVTYTYSDAKAYCEGNNYRLPTAVEVLNIVDYEISVDKNDSMIDGDFTTYTGKDAPAVWVDTTTGGNHHYIHLVGGVDVVEIDSNDHSVLCVKGDSDIISPSFSVNGDIITDNNTKYQWSKVNPDQTYTHANAENGCPDNTFSLPNINELRTIYDYGTNKLASDIASVAVTSIWSSTENFKGDSQQFFVIQNGSDISLDVGLDNGVDKRHVTCVKRP